MLYYTKEAEILKSVNIREAISSFEAQKRMWFPKGPNSGVRVIVNFTQGASAGDKRLTRRLVTYREK